MLLHHAVAGLLLRLDATIISNAPRTCGGDAIELPLLQVRDASPFFALPVFLISVGIARAMALFWFLQGAIGSTETPFLYGVTSSLN